MKSIRQRLQGGGSGLRFGIRFKTVLLIGTLLFGFNILINVFYQMKMDSILLQELERRVEVQSDYLKSYGMLFVTEGVARKDIESRIEPLLKGADMEFLAIQSKSGQTIYHRFADPSLTDEVLRGTPPTPEGVDAAVKDRFEHSGRQVVRVVIPVYSEKIEVATQVDEIFSAGDSELAQLFGDGGGAGKGASAEEKPVDTSATRKPDKILHGRIIYGVNTSNAQNDMRRLQIESVAKIALPGLLTSIAILYLMVSFGLRSLSRMVESARAISRGDLRLEVDVDSHDEIGDLARAFNRMLERLRVLISQIQSGTQRLGQVSHQLRGNTDKMREGSGRQSAAMDESVSSIEELNLAIKEINQNIDMLARSAADSSSSVQELSTTIREVDEHMEYLGQAVETTVQSINEIGEIIKQNVEAVTGLNTSTGDTVSSMHQIDATTREIEDRAKETTQLTKSVYEDARAGQTAVEKTMRGIEEISRFSTRMESVIGNLEEKSSKIVKIVDVIDDIADQTNLLALNAAIIAAQAGDKGRGFSVVANEIKELSSKTGQSIQEIAQLISDVRDESSRAAEAMGAGRKSIDTGVQLAADAGHSLQAIMSSTEAVLAKVQMIETATAEQSRGSHTVTQSMEQIASMAGQIQGNTRIQDERTKILASAAGRMNEISRQVKRATREQSSGSQVITKAMENINDMVGQIVTSIHEQRKVSETIHTSATGIRAIADHNMETTVEMDEMVKILHEQMKNLGDTLEGFLLEEERSSTT